MIMYEKGLIIFGRVMMICEEEIIKFINNIILKEMVVFSMVIIVV